MALTIVATAGSASANSFVTEAEQVAYMATRGNSSTWTTVSGATCTESEKVAMIEATRTLSALAWQGTAADDTQALAWPRAWVINPDSPNQFYYETTAIPTRVKNAACELAFQFVKSGATDLAAADPLLGIVSKQVDVLRTEYAPHLRPAGLRRLPSVWQFIGALVRGASGVTFRTERS